MVASESLIIGWIKKISISFSFDSYDDFEILLNDMQKKLNSQEIKSVLDKVCKTFNI